MKLLLMFFMLFISACDTNLSSVDLIRSEVTTYQIDENAPLIKFENGITKTVEFAFEGMDPKIELIPEENVIAVDFSANKKDLIESSEDLANTLEETSRELYKSLGQIYLFDGTLIVDQWTISE